jgi:hypothetical protein
MVARNIHGKHEKSGERLFFENLVAYFSLMFPLVASAFMLSARNDTVTFINIILTFILVPIGWATSMCQEYHEKTYYKGKHLVEVLKKRAIPRSEKRVIWFLIVATFTAMAVPFVLNFAILFQQNLIEGGGLVIMVYGIAAVAMVGVSQKIMK